MSRVLFISYDGALEPLGRSQVLPYLRGLASCGVAITLLSFEKGEDLRVPGLVFSLQENLAVTGVRWIPLTYHKWPTLLATGLDVLLGLLRAWTVIRRGRIQVVHARSYVPALMALVLKRLFGVRFLFDIRGFWVDERVEGGIWRRGLVYRLAGRMEQLLYRSADAIVSLTEVGRLAIQDFAGVSDRGVPIAVVPTCVDTDCFAPRQPDPLLLEQLGYEGKTVFTYVGSVGTWHAMEEVLDFFAVVLREIPTAALLLIVRGPLKALQESVERKGLVAATAIVSSVPNGEIPRWLSISHVGLAFYRHGVANIARFPTKIGEYLALGLPVVVSAGVGDCDHFIETERVGVVVREYTPEEYRQAVRALRELLQDPPVSGRCRQAALAHLSVAEGVRRYYSLYCRLAAGDTKTSGI